MGNRSIKKGKRKRERLHKLQEHINKIRKCKLTQKSSQHNDFDGTTQPESGFPTSTSVEDNDKAKENYQADTEFTNLTTVPIFTTENEELPPESTFKSNSEIANENDQATEFRNLTTVPIFKANDEELKSNTDITSKYSPSPDFQIANNTQSPDIKASINADDDQDPNNPAYDEIAESTLLVEVECQEKEYKTPQGRRLVDIMHFIKKIQAISGHESLFSCNFVHMSLVGEKRTGLTSKFMFKCNMCKKAFVITSEDLSSQENVDANSAAVTGITSAGMGYSQFEELTACMNVPIFTEKTYAQIQDTIYDNWEETAVESMAAAAKRERDAAIEEGKLSKDGIPVIDVYADACWSARSYGNNYKALSGAAAIVGRKFGEVLFIGIKNKYCLVCARAEKQQIATPEHVCYKNFTGSSSSMESDIICQGFENSVDMYNLIYARLIADGDSATYAKILARNPYAKHNITVQKIECRNHLLRNMCNKLRAVTKDTKYALAHRKTLTNVKIMSIRKVIIASVKQFKSEKEKLEAVTNFRKEVKNSIYHAYGDHKNCKEYYCSKDKSIQSSMEIENTTFWFRIQTIIQSVLSKTISMLEDVDTNAVERFNSIIAKIVGGKRINFSLRRGYRARCNTAVVCFNNPHPRYLLQKKILGKSPKSILKKFEERRLKKRNFNKLNPHKKNRLLKQTTAMQHDYGQQSTTPDLPEDELILAKESFIQNLKQLTADKQKLQISTINQRESEEWVELRKNMITASNFGLVVKRRENTSKAKLVENILYKSNLSNVAAIAHGVENEHIALQQLAKQEDVIIEPCGLFVDSEHPYIGATPDGLIGQDTIVEIKCPLVAFKNGLEESIKENKIQIWRYNKKKHLIELNKNSNWYFQVQGQLHVTGKKKCLFAVWSGEDKALKTEIIEKDDIFWEEKMKAKLISFYMDWLLPEIVDSRRARGMPLRDIDVTNIHSPPLINDDKKRQHGIVESARSHKMPLKELNTSGMPLRDIDITNINPSPLLNDDKKREHGIAESPRSHMNTSGMPLRDIDITNIQSSFLLHDYKRREHGITESPRSRKTPLKELNTSLLNISPRDNIQEPLSKKIRFSNNLMSDKENKEYCVRQLNFEEF